MTMSEKIFAMNSIKDNPDWQLSHIGHIDNFLPLCDKSGKYVLGAGYLLEDGFFTKEQVANAIETEKGHWICKKCKKAWKKLEKQFNKKST